jgi:hypothetical protein
MEIIAGKGDRADRALVGHQIYVLSLLGENGVLIDPHFSRLEPAGKQFSGVFLVGLGLAGDPRIAFNAQYLAEPEYLF